MTHDPNQTRTLNPFPPDTDQTRKLGLPLRSSDYDRIETENPFTKMASNPAKLDRCVDKVKGQKGVKNAYAICNASLKG